MKAKYLLASAALSTCALLALGGCGGGGYSYSSASAQQPMTSMSASAQSLDTAQLLAQARQISEQSLPYQVDDGAVTLTDTSDTSEPISVGVHP